MARLTLKSDETYRNVGRVLFEIASDQESGLQRHQQRFQDCFSNAFEGSREAREAKETVRLEFHRDATVHEKGRTVRVVHVVVPDLSHKVKPGEKPSFDFESGTLDDFAAEALGFVALMGCVG